MRVLVKVICTTSVKSVWIAFLSRLALILCYLCVL